MKRLFWLLPLLLLLSVYGQTRPAYSVEHAVHEIQSKYVNETRQILVHVPLSYKTHRRKFPVVYMLDGHTPHPEMMAGILANQAWGGAIPEMILVSIRNTDRNRDMLPTRVDRFPTSGGADRFLDYVEKEVIPLVESNYRVEPYRIFAGHSFSGLTVVYTFVNRPHLFQSYIAASPYLQWDEQFVVKQAGVKLKDRTLERTIFLGLGDEPEYENGWNGFQSVLKKSKIKGLVYEFRKFPDDSHGSVVLPVYFSGLRKIFEGYSLKGRIRADTVVAHYRELSKRFGYKVIPPEDYLNASGYFLMREEKYELALSVLKENANNYPESANVYDSLGECLEKMGRLEEAAFNFEKAMNMAEAAGNSVLTAAAKANLKRVNDKLEK
ncbi:MAG: alpha/beta hydrolase-fold protein [Acidobacteriota bacterium]|nr:alpha/beta hydrolase-fold protein [Acidobacteriota bacterium]MDH3528581.1 alpha/beta hydrolase-fold protein [Acidobacteriota bacterium]